MRCRRTMRAKGFANQQGIALLLLVIVMALASIAIYIGSISLTQVRVERERSESKTLNKAKQALISYAVTFPEQSTNHTGELGFLPLPDISADNGEGNGTFSYAGNRDTNIIGMFPWNAEEISVGILKSANGDCLFYALSGSYKTISLTKKTHMLNEDTNGLIRVVNSNGTIIVGAQPEDRAIAVIIDPGMSVDGQTRSFDEQSVCGKDYDLAHFLEGNSVIDNAVLNGSEDTVDVFIDGSDGGDEQDPPFNDRIVTISREELWQAVTARKDFREKMENLTAALAGCLAEYANLPANTFARLPWPAPFDFSGADYRNNILYTDVGAPGFYAGRYPMTINDSNAVMATGLNANIFETGQCNNLSVPNPPGTVDMSNSTNEYRVLWKNWKDHFFYLLSKGYEPATGSQGACGAGDCFTTASGANEYAAMVIFSGSRMTGQLRSAPPLGGDPENKADVNNYLEQNRPTMFPSGTGAGDIDTVDTGQSNDYMYCVTTGVPLGSSPC